VLAAAGALVAAVMSRCPVALELATSRAPHPRTGQYYSSFAALGRLPECRGVVGRTRCEARAITVHDGPRRAPPPLLAAKLVHRSTRSNLVLTHKAR
jgi:hypothetical protein